MRKFNFQRKPDESCLMWEVRDAAQPLLAKNEAELVRQMEANGIFDEWCESVLA